GAAGTSHPDVRPPVLAGGLLPGGDPLAVAGADQLRRLPEETDDLADLGGDGAGVRAEDVGPDQRIRPGDPRRVAKAPADLGPAVAGAADRAGGDRRESVGEDVRE